MGTLVTTVLDEPTLVLNRSWLPINTITVRQALVMVVKGSASVIEPETYQLHDFESWRSHAPTNGDARVHGVGYAIRLPEIVVLARYDRSPRQQVPFTRKNLYRRDEHRCQYCGTRKPLNELSIDHVVPRSRGGGSSWENCVLACLPCNVRKGDRRPSDVGMRLLRAPRRPNWSPCLGIHEGKRKPSWRKFVNERLWTTDY